MEETVYYAILGVLVFGFAVEQVLEWLNERNKPDTLPDELRAYYDQQRYSKSRAYKRAHNRIGQYSSWLSFILSFGFLAFGGFAWLNDLLIPHFGDTLFLSLAFFAVLFIASDIIGLPFAVYATFVIEERFGFNTTSPKTFLVDKIKSYVLTILLGGGLLYALLSIIQSMGQSFWIYAWVLMVLVMVFMNFFYASLFLPLFNKLKPLEDGPLREKIEALAKQLDFPLKKIQVMDASKRSNKGNAFFSGFGSQKGIVLFDTLIEKHSEDELLGILAHEIGHYKKKHIVSNLVSSILTTGIMLYLLSWFMFNPVLSKALGAEEHFLHLNLIAFAILFEPFSMVMGLIGNVVSRKHEYQADEYAVKHADKQAFKEALIKLSTENLSDLKPHPAYVFVHYSHPTLLQRLQAIDQNTVDQ